MYFFTRYVILLKEVMREGRYFYLKACLQVKIDALHHKGLKSRYILK